MALKKWIVCIVLLAMTSMANASIYIRMYSINRDGRCYKLGYIKADDTIYGVLFQPNLRYLPPGVHGFHVHACGSCNNYGLDAGDHFDPRLTHQHLGPYNGDGHDGDLPVLIVNNDGRATLPVLAPRLKLSMIQGRSLIINAGGDNYSDEPLVDGGSCQRIACGLIGYAH